MVEVPTGRAASEETLVDTEAPGSGERERELERGAAVGRYVILQKLGAGGMGVVYAAYDPELDRRVALKRLHPKRHDAASRSQGHSRLLREAQAMARLSHPNVVAIHDVGVHDGSVFLAMEYVEGRTLGDLMKAGEHPWTQMLPLVVAAGRGLAAAHEAGLVHRDFKPDNVLIRDGGGVKVTDFGLASQDAGASRDRMSLSQALTESTLKPTNEGTDSGGVSLTRTGAIMGTPAYMSPEQHLGLPTDARTDQFSFCLVLYEALYGARAFEASTRARLAVAVTEGKIGPAPAGTRVPAHVRQVVLRGLRPDPDERHPSMKALLDELAHDPAARRRRWGLSAAAGIAIAAVGFGIAQVRTDDAALCEDMGHHLDGVWDEDARGRVGEGLANSGVGFADSTFERVSAGLDAYANAWTTQRREACEAAQLRGEQSQALMDLRMACLDDRLQAMRSVVTILADADETATQNAVAAVGDLPDLARCADTVALRAAVAPPEAAIADDVAALRETLARARAHGSTGQYETGLALAQGAVETARSIDYAPVLAEALFRRGRLEHKTGAETEAEATLQESFFLAIEHHLDDVAARTGAELATLVGQSQARATEGRTWAAHARANANAADQDLLRATAIHALAGVEHTAGAYDEARTLAHRAMEIRTRELGPRHETLLASHNLLGNIASDTGKYEDARAHFEQGLELGRDILGPDHPDLGRPINNLAKIAWRQGKFEEAEAAFEQALDLLANALGPEHRNVAQLHNNLAAIAASRGDMDEAGRRFELALHIWEKALGPEHPSVADGLNNLAVVASGRGRFEQARDYDERALAIRRRTMEADHPSIAQNLNNLGEDFRNLGDLERALELHREALAMWERKLGPDHDDVALALTAVGNDLVLLGRPTEALPLLERALEVRAKLEIDEVERAHTQWTLARALWDTSPGTGRDRPRARELAEKADAAYEAGGETVERPKVRAWLARR